MRAEALRELLRVTVLENQWIPRVPHEKQAHFLLLQNKEALYGGAAGGGKSDALLMSALQYVDVPEYAAILFRRTYKDLSLPGALMDRAKEWLIGRGAKWNEQTKTFLFPSGSKLAFGHLEHEKEKYDYQGAEFQFIGFDELTQFSASQYLYLISRLRRLGTNPVPLRMRAASNPGGVGHDWVKMRFIDTDEHGPFVQALIEDNPSLNREEYEESLALLPPVEREQLRHGDWNVRGKGDLFEREKFEIVDEPPAGIRWVRYWDFAATEVKRGKDPDWTAGAKGGSKDGVFYLADMKRVRKEPGGVEALVKQTATLDGRGVSVWLEQEPGSSGKQVIDHYARKVLPGYPVLGHKKTGSKLEEWRPMSAAAYNGNVKLVNGPWISTFLDEAEAVPNVSHDDQVDAAAGAFNKTMMGRQKGDPIVF